MQKNELAAAITAAITGLNLALTKFDQAVQNFNDSLIHETNDVNGPVATALSETTTDIAAGIVETTGDVSATASVVTESPVVEATTAVDGPLDSEGFPWDSRIHAETKSQVNSKVVRGGKAWRIKRGLDDGVVEAVKAELISQGYGQPEAVSTAAPAPAPAASPATPAAASPATPGLPGSPATPAAPSTPAVAAAQESEDEKFSAIRKVTIANMNALTQVFGLSLDDIKEIMVTEFEAAQNDDQVVFGSVPYDKYQSLFEFFDNLVKNYSTIKEAIDTIYNLAGAANKPTVDSGLSTLFGNFNTTEIGGIHYSAVNDAVTQFTNWLTEWQEWANSAQA